jgi:hypothetical protein
VRVIMFSLLSPFTECLLLKLTKKEITIRMPFEQ